MTTLDYEIVNRYWNTATSSLLGRVVSWGFLLGYPWITRILKALGIAYPELSNHFFQLQLDIQPTVSSAAQGAV